MDLEYLQKNWVKIASLLDLMEFSASANAPVFDVVKWQDLKPGQKKRYKNAVMRYCGQVLPPSYGIFGDRELKRCCAELHVEKILGRLRTEALRTADHYNL